MKKKAKKNIPPSSESAFDPTPSRTDPEIFIGLVAPVGIDLSIVCEELDAAFREVNYRLHVIKLSGLLRTIDKFKELPSAPEETRIRRHMLAGTQLRRALRNDVMALLAAGAVKAFRREKYGTAHDYALRQAYVFSSLKHPHEIETLRGLYGDAFFVISVYAPREQRVRELAAKIAASHHSSDVDRFRSAAERLLAIDEEEGLSYGQNVSKSFPKADLFLDCRSRGSVQGSIRRFVELVFSYPFHTPSRDEFGMFHARAAALRSADLSRQVGAVVTDSEGNLITIGCNEVPKSGGGLYWPDPYDRRDFQLGYESGARIKNEIVAEVISRLKQARWLSKDKQAKEVSELVEQIMDPANRELMKGAQILDLLEFGRMVHAEMAAISDAAARGLALTDATMYVTTFPCHMCARHIVASGVRRVVYVEPYPKSRAQELHDDSIVVDSENPGKSFVSFEPFVGVSPTKFIRLFDMVQRKDGRGKTVEWVKDTAQPRVFGNPISYLLLETKATVYVAEELNRIGFTGKDDGELRQENGYE